MSARKLDKISVAVSLIDHSNKRLLARVKWDHNEVMHYSFAHLEAKGNPVIVDQLMELYQSEELLSECQMGTVLYRTMANAVCYSLVDGARLPDRCQITGRTTVVEGTGEQEVRHGYIRGFFEVNSRTLPKLQNNDIFWVKDILWGGELGDVTSECEVDREFYQELYDTLATR